MIELNISKNTTTGSPGFNKWYPRVDYKETISIDRLAEHMAEHNTPFSKGTIADGELHPRTDPDGQHRED